MVKELAGKVSIRTVTQGDGALNVSLANGTTLVNGALANGLTAFKNDYDPFQMEIGIEGRAGSIEITDDILGGSLGGALQFREELLEDARNQLGLLGAAIGETFNQQHQLGLDLEGDVGQQFFNSLSIGAIPSSANTGGASVSVVLDDINQLSADGFELSFNGTDWTLEDLSNGATPNWSRTI